MIYKGTIVNAKFKQVEVKGSPRAILTIRYACDDGKTYPQDLWIPSKSTSEKAAAFFDGVLETVGLPKDHFSFIVNNEWEKAFLKPDIVFEIETEVDKSGYEKVKYVDDPANPRSGGAEITDPNLMKLLGISKDTKEKNDEIPF